MSSAQMIQEYQAHSYAMLSRGIKPLSYSRFVQILNKLGY